VFLIINIIRPLKVFCLLFPTFFVSGLKLRYKGEGGYVHVGTIEREIFMSGIGSMERLKNITGVESTKASSIMLLVARQKVRIRRGR